LHVIRDNAYKFSSEARKGGQLAKPEKYVYEEQNGADEFFGPYLWQVVVQSSGLAWSLDRIELYRVPNQAQPCQEAARQDSRPEMAKEKGFVEAGEGEETESRCVEVGGEQVGSSHVEAEKRHNQKEEIVSIEETQLEAGHNHSKGLPSPR